MLSSANNQEYSHQKTIGNFALFFLDYSLSFLRVLQIPTLVRFHSPELYRAS